MNPYINIQVGVVLRPRRLAGRWRTDGRGATCAPTGAERERRERRAAGRDTKVDTERGIKAEEKDK